VALNDLHSRPCVSIWRGVSCQRASHLPDIRNPATILAGYAEQAEKLGRTLRRQILGCEGGALRTFSFATVGLRHEENHETEDVLAGRPLLSSIARPRAARLPAFERRSGVEHDGVYCMPYSGVSLLFRYKFGVVSR
jgi:hypothetical protein